MRDLIEQVLFTSPGERVNRPGFGSGLLQLVFGPEQRRVAAAVQFLVQGVAPAVAGRPHPGRAASSVTSEDATLDVTVPYARAADGQQPRPPSFIRGSV